MAQGSLAGKLKYLLKLSLINSIGLAFALYCLLPLIDPQPALKLSRASQKPFTPPAASFPSAIYGLPVRLIIPESAIDIPLDQGYYQPAENSWTLSGYRAQFAMTSALANNVEGDTFIYGHNNDFVFGSLRHNTPTSGALAIVYTANSHSFEYSFTKSYSLSPSDTAIINYSGAPILTIQTCTGSFNEWRTMYQFSFVKVLS